MEGLIQRSWWWRFRWRWVDTETGEKFSGSEDTLCVTSLRREPWEVDAVTILAPPLFICSTTDACTVIVLITGRPNHGTQGICQGDSSGPTVIYSETVDWGGDGTIQECRSLKRAIYVATAEICAAKFNLKTCLENIVKTTFTVYIVFCQEL